MAGCGYGCSESPRPKTGRRFAYVVRRMVPPPMALQKVDAVIAGVGALALLATVLGVLAYDELAGEREVTFPTTEETLGAQQGNAGTPLTFTLPQNATAARLAVDVTFDGQSGQGGTAQVTIDVTGPEGLTHRHTDSMTIGSNIVSTSTTIDVPLFSWTEPPEPRTADPASVDETRTWDEPLTVTVTVQAPNDPLTAIPGNVVTYSFTATVTPTVTVYGEAFEQPDVETA